MNANTTILFDFRPQNWGLFWMSHRSLGTDSPPRVPVFDSSFSHHMSYNSLFKKPRIWSIGKGGRINTSTLLVHSTSQWENYVAVAQCIKLHRFRARALDNIHIKHQNMEEMWSQWLWHVCRYQIWWFKYFQNWRPGFWNFYHHSL